MTKLNSVEQSSTNREASLTERPCNHPKLGTCKEHPYLLADACGKKNWFTQSDIDKFHADMLKAARKEMCEGGILQSDEILRDLQRCLYGTKTT